MLEQFLATVPKNLPTIIQSFILCGKASGLLQNFNLEFQIASYPPITVRGIILLPINRLLSLSQSLPSAILY